MCLDATPGFLGIFDFSVAPNLLFYSYVPIVAFLLFLSIYIARKDNFSLKSKLLLCLAGSFFLWVANIIIQWTVVEADIVYFAWQITALLEILIPLSVVYLVYVFIDNKDIVFWLKCIFALIILTVAVLLPTNLNMYGFDIVYCEGLVGPLTYYVYVFEVFAIFWILGLTFRRRALYIKDKTQNKEKIKQLTLISASSAVFLLIFSLSNISGELTSVYSINLFGPIGMVIFVSILSYVIVKFKAFSVKVMSAQMLVWGLAILIGSQFFFIKTSINFILNSFTFVTVLFFGQLLIESVKHEIEQKEYLQALNLELQRLIKQRESLVHLITHKVKGSFTRSKYLFAEMLEGTFGPLAPELNMMVKKGLESDIEGIATVDLVLNSANLQNGNVKYEMKMIDFKDIVEKLVVEKRVSAQGRGQEMTLEVQEGDYTVLGDTFWLKEVVINLLENSIRYTKVGKIVVSLSKNGSKILFSVKDTGIGITDEDKKNLFTEGGRGKDSVKINVDSTGYGLFSVKLILEAHKGRIWAESEGPGKGSQFFVELPVGEK